MRRICLAFVALAALSLPGCSLLLPPRPEPTKSVLRELPNDLPHGRGRAASLLVLLPDIRPAYDTTRMAYSLKLYQLAYFRDNEWAETPAQMILPLLVQTLQRTGLFEAILTPPELGATDYTLRTKILDLLQDYTVSPPVLRFAFRLQLFSASGRPVAGREIAVQEPMREATPYAGVLAANDAVAKALRMAAEFVLNSAR